ncbi:MAG: hypothetical protein ABI672_00225 [Vicinamibacteria bacterium]
MTDLSATEILGRKARRDTWVAFVAAVVIVLLLVVVMRRARRVLSFEKVQIGQLIVVEPKYAFPSKTGEASYGYVLRTDDGQTFDAEFREPLTLNERIAARYALIKGTSAIRMDAYVRCGSSPCGSQSQPQ